MINDELIITDKHKNAAKIIVESITAKEKKGKIVIGISGEAGSGKAELGHEIAWQLAHKNRRVKILHTDNYYSIKPHNREPWRRSHGGVESIGLDEYDWGLIESNLSDFRDDREEVTLPYIDLLTDMVDQLQTNFSGIKYLVIEGLYAIKAEVDFRIFIDTSYLETLKEDKEQLSRGRELLDEWRMDVLAREHQIVRGLRPLADYIITSEFEIIPSAKNNK